MTRYDEIDFLWGEAQRCRFCRKELDAGQGIDTGGALLCKDCFFSYAADVSTLIEYAADFAGRHRGEFLPWWYEGPFLTQGEKRRVLEGAYREWKNVRPGEAAEAEREFARASPGQWEEYLSLR